MQAGRQERSAEESVSDGLQDARQLFSYGGDVTANITEDLSAIQGAKRAWRLLFDFDHPHISFLQIVIKRRLEIGPKGQGSPLVLVQSVKHILGWRLFAPTSLLDRMRRIGGQTFLDDSIVTAFEGSATCVSVFLSCPARPHAFACSSSNS
jgi:hypothetical protein